MIYHNPRLVKLIIKGTFVLVFSLLVFKASSQDYDFRNFSTSDGFSHSFIYSLVQDENGYLWIGTGSGLSRYDGFGFETFLSADTLKDNFITSLLADSGSIWVGHNSGRLSRFDGRRFHFVSLSDSLLSRITHIEKDRAGRIWASTYSDGFFVLNNQPALLKHLEVSGGIYVRTFTLTGDSAMLVGTNTGLMYYRPGPGNLSGDMEAVPDFPGSNVTCIRPSRDSTGYFVSTENDGIFKISMIGNRFDIRRISAGNDSVFSGVQYLLEDYRSDLWLGTFGHGIIRLAAREDGQGYEKAREYNKSNGFPLDNINTLYQDREGDIWCGNFGSGLSRISPRLFTFQKVEGNGKGKPVYAVYASGNKIWTGSFGSLILLDGNTGKTEKIYSPADGLPEDSVTAIYTGDDKNVWVGTNRHGAWLLNTVGNTFQRIKLDGGNLENSVTCLAESGGYTWIGTRKGLCRYEPQTGAQKWYTINNGGLPHNNIHALYADVSGRLWVTSKSNILVYILGNKVHRMPLNVESGLLSLGPVCQDADSGIWVGSYGHGVFLLKYDKVYNFTVQQGLLSDYCYSVAGDGHNHIWVGHKDGLSRISTTDFMVMRKSQFGDIKGEVSFYNNATTLEGQKRLWLGTSRGLLAYHPDLEFPYSIPPGLVINSVTINNRVIDAREKVSLPPGNYEIRISYLGISLKDPEQVAYTYRLEGFGQWSEVTRDTVVTFHHITEGNYKFILKATGGDGVTTVKPLMIQFVIKKPLWKQWWFYLVIVVLINLLMYIYLKRREYLILAEKKILEEKVKERTVEIQFQKNEIVKQRDLIRDKNKSITSSIRYAGHIQKAVLPSRVYINHLFGEYFILNIPKDIVSGDFYWMTEKAGRIIFTLADCTGHGVPGAFMSLLGITLLDEIVNTMKIINSDAIVMELRNRLIQALHQKGSDLTTYDGMDIAVCVMDPVKKEIEYTGGMNDILFIHDTTSRVIKADRASVCVIEEEKSHFTKKVLKYEKGDVLYLFSDGYKDQFGGPKDKKFLAHRFYRKLDEIHLLPMEEQYEDLERTLYEWMGDNSQTDDILVMGIRL